MIGRKNSLLQKFLLPWIFSGLFANSAEALENLSCEKIFLGKLTSSSSFSISDQEKFQYLKSIYQSHRTLTLVSNEAESIQVSNFLRSIDPTQKILRLPDREYDLYQLRSGKLENYRHLVAHEIFINDAFVNSVSVIIDLRQELNIQIQEDVVGKFKKNEQLNSEITPTVDPSEKLTQYFDQSIPVGKPYLPDFIDFFFYKKLNQHFLSVLTEEDLYKIFPKRQDDSNFYARFHALRLNYPLGWWLPLSPKVIDFLDRRHLKGSFQEAVDYHRGQQLSAYIIEHQKERYWLPVQNARSPLSDWFHHAQKRDLDWKSFISKEAGRIVNQREKMARAQNLKREEINKIRKAKSDEMQKSYIERFKKLSEYIVDHQNEEDVARIFYSSKESFEDRRWAREHIRESPIKFFQSLSFVAQEVLRKRGLDQMKRLPPIKPDRK